MTAIGVSEVGEFVRHSSCERRFKLGLNGSTLVRQLPFFGRLFNPIDPVLSETGQQREDELEAQLVEEGFQRLVGPTEDAGGRKTYPTWQQFVAAAQALDTCRPAFAREVSIEGTIGAFDVHGRIDFALLVPDEDGNCRLRIAECKSSRKDRTYHRIQIAIYRRLVGDALAAQALRIGRVVVGPAAVEAVVIRIDEGTQELQPVMEATPLLLEVEGSDVRELLRPAGVLDRITEIPLADLPYEIGPKCDQCVFSIHCLPESARGRALQLIGMDYQSTRILIQNGVDTLDALANLNPTTDVARAISNDYNFNGNVGREIQRARIRLQNLPALGAEPDVDMLRDGARNQRMIEALTAARERFGTCNVFHFDHELAQWVHAVRACRQAGIFDNPQLEGQLEELRFRWSSDVERLPYVPESHTPAHVIGERALTRVFLTVHLDYVENRIGAISAHVTNSQGRIATKFRETEDGWRPDPVVIERYKDEGGLDRERPVNGIDVIQYRQTPWPVDYNEATVAERELLKSFFAELIDAIAAQNPEGQAYVHFYVWARSEIKQLIEACSRCGSGLLTSLRELLGCREPLEQLIYSCIQTEVVRRFALGWTSTGLAVVTSLSWFGRFHWAREINGRLVDLDRVFTQDIFDFKTQLDVDPDGRWLAREDAHEGSVHTFEIRSRFFDSLSAPYWRAVWGTLRRPEAPGVPGQLRGQLTRYYGAAGPFYLREYLRARAQALRWVEERIPENRGIPKTDVDIRTLRQYTLGVDAADLAALDFLRLDHFVKTTDWITSHLQAPIYRIQSGRTLPLNALSVVAANRIRARINIEDYDLSLDTLGERYSYEVGSFVRLSPCSADPLRGQTIPQLINGGITCTIASLDWDTGDLELEVIPFRAQPGERYILPSFAIRDDWEPYTNAVIDESISEFVARRVDSRLVAVRSHTYNWFNSINPQIPAATIFLPPDQERPLRQALQRMQIGQDQQLDEDQIEAIVSGLRSRVHLLQGPPGTGKTTTAAIDVLVRASLLYDVGDTILVAAATHNAVDSFLRKIVEFQPVVQAALRAAGLDCTSIVVAKLRSSDGVSEGSANLMQVGPDNAMNVVDMMARGATILGGTTAAPLKLADRLNGLRRFTNAHGQFLVDQLVIDEASMMVYPHFLALSSLVRAEGNVLLAGDHRQLSPIVAHDWENEDRPPVVLFQPFVSAYEAMHGIFVRGALAPECLSRAALTFSFRLPRVIRHLIKPVYDRDAIRLRGRDTNDPIDATLRDWRAAWCGSGLVLVIHNEASSARTNRTEVEIIASILGVAPDLEPSSVAVVTPHRAQRSLLRNELDRFGDVIHVIDTVERLQGGERPVVFMSATASDPGVLSSRAEFLLNLNRANVAFSRAQRLLIVVCSESVLSAIPAELEKYESAALWKALREICTQEVARMPLQGGYSARIMIPDFERLAAEQERDDHARDPRAG